MKKVFGQTVRDLKREVNKTVLKVPRIEQKVLDATSNEPWGPHGSLLAEIAHTSRNYHDFQLIMAVVWKRVNDNGKNWRHVYKGLTVLEYLVAHGSERVIDEIKEHSYQLSSLSSFQYIDSSGRDQGANIRKKVQSLVALVNDPERINEVRQKAAANRDKFHAAPSAGGMGRTSSYAGGYGDSYDNDRYEGRYGSRDEDRNGNGYGRERDYDYRDDDRNSRNGDLNRRDEDRYSRDGSRDGDNCGRRSVDDHRYHDDNAQDGGGRDDDQSQAVRGAPPSYEEAVSESRSPAPSERDRETSTSMPAASSPPATNAPCQSSPTSTNQTIETFDEFDPRSSVTAAPTIPNTSEMDLLGSLSDFTSNPPDFAAAAPSDVTAAFGPDSHMNSGVGTSGAETSVSNITNQAFEDPFGDNPFVAIPSNDGFPPQSHSSASMDPLQSSVHQSHGLPQGGAAATTEYNLDFGDTFSASTCPPGVSSLQAPTNLQSLPQASSATDSDFDILADILPPTGPASNVAFQPTYSFPGGDQPAVPSFSDSSQLTQQDFTALTLSTQPPESNSTALSNFHTQSGATAPMPSNLPFQPQNAPTGQVGYGMISPQGGSTALFYPQSVPTAGPNPQAQNGEYFMQNGAPQTAPQNPTGPAAPLGNGDAQHHSFTAPVAPQLAHLAPNGPAAQLTSDLGNILPQAAPNPQMAGNILPQAAPNCQMAGNIVPQAAPYSQLAGNIVPQAAPNSQMTSNIVPQGAPNSQMASNIVPQAAPNSQMVCNVSPQAPPNSQMLGNFHPQATSSSQFTGNIFPQAAPNSQITGSVFPQAAPNSQMASQQAYPNSVGALALVVQPPKGKFETKSAVWADTLNRGLVDLNISGPKTNPLSDIGVDFDAINRREKRMEKPTTTAVTSTVTMGKAMGSGSGMGRAGASALRAPPNPMMGSGMGMGGYGGIHQPMAMGANAGMNPGMGMGMGMNPGMNPSMGMGMNPGMNMGLAPGMQFQRPVGFPPGANVPGTYNPMMGGYAPQQSYGGGYQ